jgi:hypothetical protein
MKMRMAATCLLVAGTLATGLAGSTAASAAIQKPDAVTAWSGSGEVHAGGSSKSWCLSVKNIKAGKPILHAQGYVEPCGAPGYEQNWLVSFVQLAGTQTGVGELSPLSRPDLCLWLSEGSQNSALQECSPKDARTAPLAFHDVGGKISVANKWTIELYDELLTVRNPIKAGYAQWFPPNNKRAQVWQLPDLHGVTEEAHPAVTTDAFTRPESYTGYHFTGLIHPNGERGQCLTAARAEAHAQLYVFGCTPGDPLQEWVALNIGGSVLIALAAHPNLIIGGIPAHGTNAVELIDEPTGKDVPLPQSMYISGSMKHNAVNRIRNNPRQYISTPQRGHQIFWAGLTIRKTWNAGWVFSPPPLGTGWVAETIE